MLTRSRCCAQARPVLEGRAPKVDQQEVNQQTGRWGEELVFAYLQWQLAAYSLCAGTFCDKAFVCPTTGWLVEWINYREETRRPFDILIRYDWSCCHWLVTSGWYFCGHAGLIAGKVLTLCPRATGLPCCFCCCNLTWCVGCHMAKRCGCLH